LTLPCRTRSRRCSIFSMHLITTIRSALSTWPSVGSPPIRLSSAYC
jgi:hypothetical protein